MSDLLNHGSSQCKSFVSNQNDFAKWVCGLQINSGLNLKFHTHPDTQTQFKKFHTYELDDFNQNRTTIFQNPAINEEDSSESIMC